MYKSQHNRSIMRRKIIYVFLLQVILLWMSAVSSSAHATIVNDVEKPVQVASLGETSQKPILESASGIDGAHEQDILAAKECNDRGIIYSEKNQYDLALSEFNEALAIDAMSSETYNNRGITYSKKGQYDLAIAISQSPSK